MTNEQIIWQSRLDLMEKGIIGKTGRLIPVEDKDNYRARFPTPSTKQRPKGLKAYNG